MINKRASILTFIFTIVIVLHILSGCQLFGSNTESSIVNSNQADMNKKNTNNIVLPQTERKAEVEKNVEEESLQHKNPFEAPMSLTGVLYSNTGKNIAIIETDNTSYVTKEGDVIAEYWRVEKIGKGKVILKSDQRELTLELLALKTTNSIE